MGTSEPIVYKHGKVRALEKKYGHCMIPRGTLSFKVIKAYLHLRALMDTRFFLSATSSMVPHKSP